MYFFLLIMCSDAWVCSFFCLLCVLMHGYVLYYVYRGSFSFIFLIHIYFSLYIYHNLCWVDLRINAFWYRVSCLHFLYRVSFKVCFCSGLRAGHAGVGDHPHQQEARRGDHLQQEEEGLSRSVLNISFSY